ncbi:hypothetical protein EYF80_043006 [Liparis tanakae]|uniref:Uncharacterized protein n=1 Tax=Liparis tanakae TaxID=230148 RepID=A0A4Z2G102_9TELE|nr:hypothetical protein EYF80_043006 [Liparis tanakae]
MWRLTGVTPDLNKSKAISKDESESAGSGLDTPLEAPVEAPLEAPVEAPVEAPPKAPLELEFLDLNSSFLGEKLSSSKSPKAYCEICHSFPCEHLGVSSCYLSDRLSCSNPPASAPSRTKVIGGRLGGGSRGGGAHRDLLHSSRQI